MPTNIRLTTMPGKIRKGRICDALVLDLLGSSLGREDISIRKPADVVAAVRAFGERVRAEHPNASFMVNISIRKGERKPPGYDAADKAGLFDERAFMHVEAETDSATKTALLPDQCRDGHQLQDRRRENSPSSAVLRAPPRNG